MKLLSFYKESYTGLPRTIWFLSLVIFINRAGAMVLPFLSLYLTKELGYTFIEAGFLLAFTGIGSLIGTFIGGQLTDKIGHYYVQLGSLVLSGFAFFMLMQLTGFYELCVGLLVTSAFTDALRPANMASVAEYSTPALRTRSIGLIRLAINLGFSAGPAVGGAIAVAMGYQWLFFLDGITCLLAAGMFVWLIPKSSPIAEVEEEVTSEQSNFKSPFHDRVYLVFIFFVTITGLVFMQYFHTVPVYLEQELGLDERYIGGMMAFNGLLICLIEIPLIHYLEGRVHPFKLLIIGAVFIGAAFLVFNFGQVVLFAWMSILFLTVGEVVNFPFATSMVLNRSPQKGRGKYMALYNMSFSTCSIFAPILGFGLAATYDFATLWYVIFGMSLAVAVGYVFLKPRFVVRSKVASK